MIKTLFCPRCGKTKKINEFYKKRETIDSCCKICRNNSKSGIPIKGMRLNEIEVGDTVECYDREGFKRDFQGIVNKKNDNSVLVYITAYAEEDEYKVRDLSYKIVVSLRRIRKV